MNEYQEYTINWRGRELNIRYCPDWSIAYKRNMGSPIAHLTVQSNDGKPIPISETGFISRFIFGGIPLEMDQSIDHLIEAWLNEEAKKQPWQEYLRDSAQLTLF